MIVDIFLALAAWFLIGALSVLIYLRTWGNSLTPGEAVAVTLLGAASLIFVVLIAIVEHDVWNHTKGFVEWLGEQIIKLARLNRDYE